MGNSIPLPPSSQPSPPNRIRVETAISRFPIHRLTKKGTVAIDLHRVGEDGTANFKWEVTYNSKHGQPGPLAYKVDTLVVNRILDQLSRPLPELVKVGSLSDVCRLLGTQDTGPNIAGLRNAFLQNASAFINAKIKYKMKNGREKWGEMGYTRYSVVFTGEALPDGRQADAVHIILNPPYRELLNQVETRPLDYDYLKKLPPGPQRFYELLSFQIYGAIAGGRRRAKMIYSEYCGYAPQVRYLDFNHLKKQMYKIHLPHRESGYINKVDYEQTLDADGKVNWEMFYTPGPKAFAEYEAFTNRQPRPNGVDVEVTPLPTPASLQITLPLSVNNPSLFEELIKRGITEKKSRELLANAKPEQAILDQIEYVDSIVAKDKRRKLDNPPGLYIVYIRDNIVPPPNFWSSRKAGLYEEAQQSKNVTAANNARLELEYDQYRTSEVERFIAEEMSSIDYQAVMEIHRKQNQGLFKSMTSAQLETLTEATVRTEIIKKGRCSLLSFDDFSKARKP